MAAFLEHANPYAVEYLLSEAKRVLKKDGILVITTPAPISDWLLRLMALVNLVSKEEIDEHKQYFGHWKLKNTLLRGGFNADGIRVGSFEFFLNNWAVVKKVV